MSTLLLVRHGQASFGAEVYDQLSPLGEQQAAATGIFLRDRGLRFDQVLSGPLRRQSGTGRTLLAALEPGQEPVVEPALAEFAEAQQVLRSAERLYGGPVLSEAASDRARLLRQHDRLIAQWAAGHASIDGAADMCAFRQTVVTWFRCLQEAPPPRQRVLAVTSAGVIGTLVCEVLGLPDARMIEFTRVVGNASLTEIVFTPDRCSLMGFNSNAHLPAGLCSAT